MGFEFSETMSGTVEWDAVPGQRHPFRFDVTAHASSLRDHMFTGQAELRGKVLAPPKARDAAAEGTITIRPLGGRIIKYELAFTGDDGAHYSIVGQKDIDFWHPLKTFTTLPADIVDADHHRVGTCLTRFDLRRDWWRFLRSFRPA
jgi:hypothetical protein